MPEIKSEDFDKDPYGELDKLAELFYENPEQIDVTSSLPISTDLKQVNQVRVTLERIKTFDYSHWEDLIESDAEDKSVETGVQKGFLPEELLEMLTIMKGIQNNYKDALVIVDQQETRRASDLEVVLHIALRRILHKVIFDIGDETFSTLKFEDSKPPALRLIKKELELLHTCLSVLKSIQSNGDINQFEILEIYEYIREQANILLYEMAGQNNIIINLKNKKEYPHQRLSEQITSSKEDKRKYKKRKDHYNNMCGVIVSHIDDF